MNKEFLKAHLSSNCEWLSWLGMPILYDWGLCVNRDPIEVAYSKLHKGSLEV